MKCPKCKFDNSHIVKNKTISYIICKSCGYRKQGGKINVTEEPESTNANDFT